MMNIMGGSRPSEYASKNQWQGLQSFPPEASDTSAGSNMFTVPSYTGMASNPTQNYMNNPTQQLGMSNLFGTSAMPGGGWNGSAINPWIDTGGATGSGAGVVGPAQGGQASISSIIGAFSSLATGNIPGAISSILGGIFGKGSMIGNALLGLSGYNPDTAPNALAQTGPLHGGLYGIDVGAVTQGLSPDPFGGTYGGVFGGLGGYGGMMGGEGSSMGGGSGAYGGPSW
jgi:hypothetical protein